MPDLCILSPWPAETAAQDKAVEYIRANCAGRTMQDRQTACQLGEAAGALVEREAPDAPRAIKNEACIRVIGYLAEAGFGGVAKESIGPRDVEFTPFPSMAPIFRNSGAKGLLAPWRVRHAGAIG